MYEARSVSLLAYGVTPSGRAEWFPSKFILPLGHFNVRLRFDFLIFLWTLTLEIGPYLTVGSNALVLYRTKLNESAVMA